MESSIECLVIYNSKFQMIASVSIRSDRDQSHHMLKDPEQQQGTGNRDIHPCPYGETDPGSEPDPGGGGQPFDTASHFDDHSGAQKADAADSLCRDPGGIRPAGSIGFHSSSQREVSKTVLGNQHDQSSRTADQDVCPYTGVFKPLTAFHTDQGADNKCNDQPDTEPQILCHGKLTVIVCCKSHAFSSFA